MIRRNITSKLLETLKDTPIALINGARQTGKSTLAQWIASGPYPARYLTLDDAAVLSAAYEDPAGFLAGFEGPIVIDEVQLVPELFRAIKREVDRDRTPGRFLLTGSADVMLIPRLSESLAGRMEIHRLCPFSQGELSGTRERFIETLFQDKLPLPKTQAPDRKAILEKVIVGGFPEAVERASQKRRHAWFGAYITTVLQRDIRNLADIEGYTQLPRLMHLLALQATSLLNIASLSRSAGIAYSTLKRHLALIEATFLIHILPAWSGNVRKRLTRSPKVLFTDSGLLAYLLEATMERLTNGSPLAGPLLENFVGAELLKQLTWSNVQGNLFYYRTVSGREVDYVLEDSQGRIIGLEVKASATVDAGDRRGLQDLADATGKRFHRGVILYTGREAIPFSPRLHALPISALWQLGAEN